jgi:hypothetical protein
LEDTITDNKKMIINIRVYQYINLFNMTKCCKEDCYSRIDIKTFYSHIIGADDEGYDYCGNCYKIERDTERDIIKFEISKGNNIASIVKQKYIPEYVNPKSSDVCIKPMNVLETGGKIINGVYQEYVLINLIEYNNFMIRFACSNRKLVNDEFLTKKREQQQKQDEVELAKTNAIEQRARREKEAEEERIRKIKKQEELNKSNNEKLKKQREEFREENKEKLAYPGAKEQKCEFCKTYKVFPFDFRNEHDEPFRKVYYKQKDKYTSICCIDCFYETEQKKEDYKLNHTQHCPICKTSYIMRCDADEERHLNTAKCLAAKEEYYKYKKTLSLLTIKDLQAICKKTLNDDGTYRISNYSRMTKKILIDKMNDIYDLLVFSN